MGQITEPSSVAFGADGRSIAVGGAEFTLKRRGFVGLWELPDLSQGAEPQSEHLSNATKVLGEGYVERIAVGQIPIGDDRTTQRLAAQFGDNITVWEVIGDKLEEVARIPGGEQTLLGFLGGGSAPLTFNAQTKQILAWPLRGPATWEAFRESDPKIVFGSQNNSLLTATWRALEDANRGDIDSVPSISTWPASGSPPLDSQWSRETWNLTDISLGVDVSSSDAFALSPDGQFVLVALENNMRSIVNIQAKKPIATFSLPKVGSTTGLSPEARVIGYVDTSDRGDAVILVDPSGRKNPRTKVFSEKIGAMAFSGDGQHMVVAVGGDSNIITTIIRLKLDGLTETARFDVDKPIATVGMNGDGTLIAVAGRSTVRVWQVPLPSVLGFFTHAAVPTLSYEVHTAVDLDIESVALSR